MQNLKDEAIQQSEGESYRSYEMIRDSARRRREGGDGMLEIARRIGLPMSWSSVGGVKVRECVA